CNRVSKSFHHFIISSFHRFIVSGYKESLLKIASGCNRFSKSLQVAIASQNRFRLLKLIIQGNQMFLGQCNSQQFATDISEGGVRWNVPWTGSYCTSFASKLGHSCRFMWLVVGVS
ncbi:hypothetical protein RYX36_012237, partial [Vicia faba]